MEPIIQSFVQLGALGVMCAALFYMVVNFQRKIFNIIENNTRAMVELKGVIDKCQAVHRYVNS